MPYGLEKLLCVRVLREDRARHRLAREKADLAEARLRREEKGKELEDYRQWRLEEENRLFAVLKSKHATPQELRLFNGTTDTLRQNQALKAQQFQEAAQAVKKAEENLAEARRHYFTANRKKIKIEEHKSFWSDARRVLEEQCEEKEMETYSAGQGFGLTDPGLHL